MLLNAPHHLTRLTPRSLVAGLAWANLQVSFPMKGVGKTYNAADEEVVAARRLHILGEKRADEISRRRLARRISEDDDEDEEDGELSSTEQFLMSMGMSAEEVRS